MSNNKILLRSKGLVGFCQRRIGLTVFDIARCSEQICIVLRLRNNNTMACYDRRVVFTPFARIAVDKEKNSTLAVVVGRFVIKALRISIITRDYIKSGSLYIQIPICYFKIQIKKFTISQMQAICLHNYSASVLLLILLHLAGIGKMRPI